MTLDDKRATTDRLLRAGADIHALNTVRKHCRRSRAAGSRRAPAARATRSSISDVVGDDPSFIASGPTVADASRFEDALDVLRRFGGEAAYPAAVVARLRRGATGAVPETPKPGDARLARGDDRHRIAARRDGRRGRRGRRRSAITSLRLDDAGRRRGADDRGRAPARGAGARRRPRPAGVHRLERRDDGPRHRPRQGRPQSGVRARRRRICSRGGRSRLPCRQRRHRRHRRSDRRGRRDRRLDHARPGRRRRPGARAATCPTTTPTRFSTRWAISSTRVRPARTSATSK